jgi:cytochrome c5
MDYHKIVLFHRIVVSLFLLHYVVKLALLLLKKTDLLATYTAKTKVVEMIVSALFLLTGVYLIATGPALITLQWIKIAVVLASIPMAIIGFKKGNVILAVLSVLFILGAYGMAEVAKKKRNQVKTEDLSALADKEKGQAIYMQSCTSCHGPAGDAMIGDAKNLRESKMDEVQMSTIIKNGNAGMPPFKDITDEDLKLLVSYVQTLKK